MKNIISYEHREPMFSKTVRESTANTTGVGEVRYV